MANDPRSSFIPKESTGVVTTQGSLRRRRHISIFTFLSSTLFFGSLVLAGGTFVYKGIVEKNLLEQQNALQAEKDQFNQDDMEYVRATDRLLNAALYRLDNHLAPSKLFGLLETATKRGVQFTSFSYSRSANTGPVLVLSGITDGFRTVAVQIDEFKENEALERAIFSGISKSIEIEGESEGSEEVTFSVDVSLEPRLFTYGERQIGSDEVVSETETN